MMRLLRGATAAAALLALAPGGAARAAGAGDPTGTWRFDHAALEAVADQMAAGMAGQITPEEKGLQEEALKEMEASHDQLVKTDPAAAKEMEPRLAEARERQQAMSSDPKAYLKQMMMASLASLEKARLKIEPGGKVEIEGLAGEEDQPQTAEGTWRLDGDQLEILAALPGEEGGGAPDRMAGRFTGDRIELKQIAEPPGEPADEAEQGDVAPGDEASAPDDQDTAPDDSAQAPDAGDDQAATDQDQTDEPGADAGDQSAGTDQAESSPEPGADEPVPEDGAEVPPEAEPDITWVLVRE